MLQKALDRIKRFALEYGLLILVATNTAIVRVQHFSAPCNDLFKFLGNFNEWDAMCVPRTMVNASAIK